MGDNEAELADFGSGPDDSVPEVWLVGDEGAVDESKFEVEGRVMSRSHLTASLRSLSYLSVIDEAILSLIRTNGYLAA